MELSLITPFKKLLANETVSELFAPGVEGQLNILEGHANFVTELETGVLSWKLANGVWKRATVSYGWLEIYNGRVTILADVSELAEDIDLNRAKIAETAARTKIEAESLDDAQLKKMDLKLKRAIARQSVSATHH